MLVFSETFEDIDRSNAIFMIRVPEGWCKKGLGWLWHDWPE